MAFTLYVHHIEEDRPATQEEIERLLLNCWSDGSGKVSLDTVLPNGIAMDGEKTFRFEVS
ncbi:hypothetical protein BGLA2_1720053 [Burkholderia gladioli]|uniref:hypothetical protein n=1 Tax=Burkholderia gladioli TaxID=28095 RepID=UPI001CAC41E1|nr:hypothetical protein [Burkholderia gladioli]CAG9205465.1 hypothetical protein BGLA2_1720053 [Burkholderia gladioli]